VPLVTVAGPAGGPGDGSLELRVCSGWTGPIGSPSQLECRCIIVLGLESHAGGRVGPCTSLSGAAMAARGEHRRTVSGVTRIMMGRAGLLRLLLSSARTLRLRPRLGPGHPTTDRPSHRGTGSLSETVTVGRPGGMKT
jgi:hypothetical protein